MISVTLVAVIGELYANLVKAICSRQSFFNKFIISDKDN